MNKIYQVDPKTNKTVGHAPTSLAAAGIQERRDLQEWLLGHIELLGEDLCIISSEFDAFNRAKRRIDILAMDAEANLVVIELKLAIENTFADLQALRYAAFCSTMTLDQVVSEYARFHRKSEAEAHRAISDFLDAADELPQPGDHPRVVLVAGSMDEPEIISTALWLRSFGIDIRCVEISAYQMADSSIILVPKILVPLPEAEEYQVKVERKEAVRARREREPGPFSELLNQIALEFEGSKEEFPLRGKPTRTYLKVPTGTNGVHFEWLVRKGDGEMHVAVHFEQGEAERNYDLLSLMEGVASEIGQDVQEEFRVRKWGSKWAFGAFVLPLPCDMRDEAFAKRAAELMVLLIDRTWPLIEQRLSES